jgi:hypothetical protein
MAGYFELRPVKGSHEYPDHFHRLSQQHEDFNCEEARGDDEMAKYGFDNA